ncbi:pirin family protein [Altericroceibacterium spongiae]|nr:pirin-like C-terminal cupin domain-containing protein [Altericroceibacterium spongiae]
MTIQFSSVIAAEKAELGSGFSALRVEPGRFGGAADPIMGFDHYRMNAVTFAPHPHAGFSAISYLFEDSTGGLRNRDSLGNDFVVGPGGIVWTQAGEGVLHDELPAKPGREVHGLQIFINMSAAAKNTPPLVMRLDGSEVPVSTVPGGSTVRIVAGSYRGIASPLQSADSIDLLDCALIAGSDLDFPLEAGRNMLVYCESGEVRLTAKANESVLTAGDAVAISVSDAADSLRIGSDSDARIVLLCGQALNEPVVQYGPFIMNSEAQIGEAAMRYRSGAMGRLEPLS